MNDTSVITSLHIVRPCQAFTFPYDQRARPAPLQRYNWRTLKTCMYTEHRTVRRGNGRSQWRRFKEHTASAPPFTVHACTPAIVFTTFFIHLQLHTKKMPKHDLFLL